MANKFKNRILETRLVKWREIRPLQPETFKHIFNYQALEDSLLKHGFAQPFYVWQYRKKLYAIDGHTRKEVLLNLEADHEIPEMLPATFIDAKTKKEAIQILLEVYNQKQNPIDQVILNQWLKVENVNVENVAVTTINIKPVVPGNDFSNDNQEIDPDNLSSEMTITLKFEEEVYHQVRAQLTKIAENPSDAVLKLLKGYE